MYNPLPYSANRFPVQKLPSIVKLNTTAVTTDTAASEVIYTICCWKWKQLCKEGLMILQIDHTPADGSAAFLVSIATSNTTTVPLIDSTGTQVASSQIVRGSRYLVYYNKCDGTFQLVNFTQTT